MRIISGHLKGREIKAPKGMTTRPTSSKVRESLFNILIPYLEEAHFLDLFAGSGVMGIEALSRGASSATFVEKNAGAASAIRHNLKTLDIEGKLIQRDVFTTVKQLEQASKQFDIIFIDPPYALDISPLFAYLPSLLAENGILIIEQGRSSQLTFAPFKQIEIRRFGDTELHFLEKPS